MIDYLDAPLGVRGDFAAAHSRFWERLRRPGTWWTSEERIAIAKETRTAWQCGLCQRRKEALSPFALQGEHESDGDVLPAVAVDAIHRITTDASRLTRDWYEGVLAQGLSDGHYIELVGTVAAMASVDSFAIAMGVSLRALPGAGAGAPSNYRPATAGADDAWVPMVHVNNEGTPEADLWPCGKTGNVIRAMSLVPDEVRTLKDLSAAHYLANEWVRKTGVDRGGALNRSQMELVAGRVSALNACYY
ncbi:MAG: hypothetical protein GKR94_28430 [Gammaproteobacteria bacterium]|nr:hypothetical protein [Gammaproteobacteria bacterium]